MSVYTQTVCMAVDCSTTQTQLFVIVQKNKQARKHIVDVKNQTVPKTVLLIQTRSTWAKSSITSSRGCGEKRRARRREVKSRLCLVSTRKIDLFTFFSFELSPSSLVAALRWASTSGCWRTRSNIVATSCDGAKVHSISTAWLCYSGGALTKLSVYTKSRNLSA